jgi:hypothetical protein
MRLREFIALAVCAACAASSHAFPKEHLDFPPFRFYFDTGHSKDIQPVLRSATAAYGRLKMNLDFAPQETIPVVLYSDGAEFRRDVGVNRSELVLGVATNTDETIRLDASKVFDSPDRVVGHEITHIFLFRYLGERITSLPLWMNEGMAQVAGGASPEAAKSQVTNALLNGRMTPLGGLTSQFPSGENAGLAYDEGQAAVVALLDDGGWPRLRALLGQMKAGKSFSASMRDVYGQSPEDWESRWRRSMRFQARFAIWAQIAEWVVPFMMFAALVWGISTVRRHRKKQIVDEEPVVELEPPSWWREDQWR